MDILPQIEEVIRKHQNFIVENFSFGSESITVESFTEWMKNESDSLRDFYYGDQGQEFSVGIWHLNYLIQYAPCTTASSRSLVTTRWPRTHFRNWVQGKEGLGICSVGSGPGSDIFGVIQGIADVNPNPQVKIRHVIRKEKSHYWEHFYQSIKKEIVRSDFVNFSTIWDSHSNPQENTNESLNTILKRCHDQWIGEVDEQRLWAAAYAYSKCDVLSLQHVISDPSMKGTDSGEHFDSLCNDVEQILSFMKKPAIVLVSDISSLTAQRQVDAFVTRMQQRFETIIVAGAALTGSTHNGMTHNDYMSSFGQPQHMYNHYQAIIQVNG